MPPGHGLGNFFNEKENIESQLLDSFNQKKLKEGDYSNSTISLKTIFPAAKDNLDNGAKYISSERLSNQTYKVITKLEPIEKAITVELQSDKQYDLNQKIFVAEGNVKLILHEGELRAEKIEFNRELKELIATGNVRFKKGYQYFMSENLRYNFDSKEGELRDVYGILNLNYLANDLTLVKTNISSERINALFEEGEVKDIKLVDGYRTTLGKANSKVNYVTRLDKNTGSINKWRIKSSLILLQPKGWTAKEVSFFNDPLNPSQTRIDAKNVVAIEDENQSTIITATRSTLVLEDFLRIPTGNRTFEKKEKSKWRIGIDNKDRDGLFIARKLETLKLFGAYNLDVEPQYFLQRSLQEKTNSYIAKNASVISDPAPNDYYLSDLFGFDFDLEGEIFNWDMDLSANLSTLNYNRMLDGMRLNGDISKSYKLPLINEVKFNLFSAYRFKAWNGSLGETNIYTANGGYILKEGGWKNGKLNDSYSINIGFANYQAESNSRDYLASHWRTSLYSQYVRKYNLWKGKIYDLEPLTLYRFSPVRLVPELNFISQINSSYFSYDDGNNQLGFGLIAGPEFILGRMQKTMFDYTKLSLLYGIHSKSGSSPFQFDKIVDLKKLTFDLTQQIYGPILFNAKSNLNIDPESDRYGDFYSSSFSLLFQKRAYDVGLFYQPEKGYGGLLFRMNGFDFTGSGKT